MSFGRVVLVGTAKANVRADYDQRWPGCLRLRGLDRAIDRRKVVDVSDVLGVPSIRIESRGGIVAERERRIAFDRDVVVVVKTDQLAEFMVPGE